MIDKGVYVTDIKESLKELAVVLKDIFPKNTKELTLLILLFFFYMSFGWVIANETCIQDCLIKRYDVYLNFDSGSRFHGRPFGYDIAHPLFNLYSTPVSLVLEFFMNLYNNYKIKTIGFALVCNLMVSVSSVYVYRYLVEIVKITNRYVLALFVSFYAFSYTCLVLSFTIETYSFSIFFLSFTVYCYSKQIQNDQRFRFLTNLFFCFIVGGMTITNTSKSMIVIFFTNDGLRKKVKQVFIIGCILLVCFFVAIYREDFFNFFVERFWISMPSEKSYWLGWEFLTSGNILFPSVTVFQEMIPKESAILVGLEYRDYFLHEIQIVPFSYIWEHAYTLLLTLLIFIPLFTDFKNKLVQLLFLLFSVEIILHIVIKYGMLETYLYGGHWIYIFGIGV